MTDHPAKGCTKRQIEAFEWIAVGQPYGYAQSTLEALERKGLISFQDKTLPPDKFSRFPVVVKEPFVPLPVHYQWCTWCAEQDDAP